MVVVVNATFKPTINKIANNHLLKNLGDYEKKKSLQVKEEYSSPHGLGKFGKIFQLRSTKGFVLSKNMAPLCPYIIHVHEDGSEDSTFGLENYTVGKDNSKDEATDGTHPLLST